MVRPDGPEAGERERLLRVLADAQSAYFNGNVAHALTQFMDVLGCDCDRDIRARALCGAGGVLGHSGRVDLAGRLLSEASELAFALDNQRLQLAIASNWSLLDLSRMAYANVLRRTQLLARMSIDSLDNAQPMWAVLINRATAANELRQFDESLKCLDAAARLAEECQLGFPMSSMGRALRARVLVSADRVAEAKLLLDLLASERVVGLARLYCRLASAGIDEAEHRLDTAEASYRVIADDVTTPRSSRLAAQRGLIRVLTSKADHQAALDELARFCNAIVDIRGTRETDAPSAREQVIKLLSNFGRVTQTPASTPGEISSVNRAVEIVRASVADADWSELQAVAHVSRAIAIRGGLGDAFAQQCFSGELLSGVLSLDGLDDSLGLVSSRCDGKASAVVVAAAYRLLGALGVDRDSVAHQVVAHREETPCGSGPLGLTLADWDDATMVDRVARRVCQDITSSEPLGLGALRISRQGRDVGAHRRWQRWLTLGDALVNDLAGIGNTFDAIIARLRVQQETCS